MDRDTLQQMLLENFPATMISFGLTIALQCARKQLISPLPPAPILEAWNALVKGFHDQTTQELQTIGIDLDQLLKQLVESPLQ